MNPTLRQRVNAFLHPFEQMMTSVPFEVARKPQPKIPALNPDSDQPFEAYFSPKGGCAAALAREINKANISLRIQAYQLTHPDVQAAILGRIKAKIPTEIILDKTQQQYKFGKQCQDAGADVYDDHTVKIAHNKCAWIEYTLTKGSDIRPGESRAEPCPKAYVLINGSFNFTDNAEESNAENMVVHRCHLFDGGIDLYKAFVISFDSRKSASLVWGTEHATLGLELESETLEERNERLNG